MHGVQVVKQSGETELVFESVLDVAHARHLYSELDSALAASAPLVLDAGHVERVDTATLQLLAAFCCAARDAGLSLHWRSVSVTVLSAAALLDLKDALGRFT